MKKKIATISILAIFMIATISFASATNTSDTDVGRKESPLYGLRTKRAVSEKITDIIENIRTRFLGNRMFFLPVQRIQFTTIYSLLGIKAVTCGSGPGVCLPTSM